MKTYRALNISRSWNLLRRLLFNDYFLYLRWILMNYDYYFLLLLSTVLKIYVIRLKKKNIQRTDVWDFLDSGINMQFYWKDASTVKYDIEVCRTFKIGINSSLSKKKYSKTLLTWDILSYRRKTLQREYIDLAGAQGNRPKTLYHRHNKQLPRL